MTERALNVVRRHPQAFVSAPLVLTLILGAWWLFKPRPVQDTRAFGAASAAMDGGNLNEATRLFTVLGQTYPQSAYPKIGLARTLELAGEVGSKAPGLWEEIPKCPDAERALRDRLAVEPSSSKLQTELGWYYLLQSNDHRNRHELDQANAARQQSRAILETVCRTASATHQAFALLSDVEAGDQATEADLRSSVAHIEHAISLAESAQGQTEPTQLADYLLVSLPRLQRYIQKVEGNALTPDVCATLEHLLDRMEARCQAVDFEWTPRQKQMMKGTRTYALNFYRGLLALERARLLAVQGQHVACEQELRVAKSRLTDASDEQARWSKKPGRAVPRPTPDAPARDTISEDWRPGLDLLRSRDFRFGLGRADHTGFSEQRGPVECRRVGIVTA